MLQTRVIPCLLLKGTSLVKSVRFKDHQYIGDPIHAVHLFNEMEVDELILLDIGATRERRRPNFDLIGTIASECFMPLAYGGGIRELEDIRTILRIGVEKVAVNTYAFERPDFIREAADTFGSQSIIVSMDVKRNFFGRYEAWVRNGTKATHLKPSVYASQAAALGAGEILLNSIDRDGTWEGYDLKLIQEVTSAVNVPVIVCGGAGKLEHFGEAVKKAGASTVAAGSMFVFQGKGQGVLINFPARKEIEAVLASG